MCVPVAILVLLFAVIPSTATSADLAFKSEGNGVFSFDTGVVSGKLRADANMQGIESLVQTKTGVDLAYGQGLPGIFSHYRVFSTSKRYEGAARSWPKEAKVIANGDVEIHWAQRSDHPFEMTAVYHWAATNVLDLETTVKPTIDMKDFEVFLSSYFGKGFRSYVYVNRTLHAPGKPFFLSADVNDLVAGTYLAFPRDRKAAQMIYDGRWEYKPNPVHFSVAKFFAEPLCMRYDAESGITALMMAKPEDCFAIETPYNMDPPDGIAGHYSMYMSLFGTDVKAGQPVRAHTRLIIAPKLSEEKAVSLYRKFLDEAK